MSNEKKVAVVLGVGPGTGAALARRFAKEGYAVALLARSTETTQPLEAELPGSKAFACDASDATSVEKAFADIRSSLGEVDVLVYNAGSGVFAPFEDVTAEQFESSWRINTLGAFVASKAVVESMKKRGAGSIIFIGATASRRGNKMTSAFAPAKAAQRSLAESLARTYWPSGVHVAVVIVDGVIDLERTRKRMPDKPDGFFMKPDDIAETVWNTVEQPRSTWSFEVEARPFGETW